MHNHAVVSQSFGDYSRGTARGPDTGFARQRALRIVLIRHGEQRSRVQKIWGKDSSFWFVVWGNCSIPAGPHRCLRRSANSVRQCAWYTLRLLTQSRLSKMGQDIGRRLYEVVCFETQPAVRHVKLVPFLQWIQTTLWPAVFGKPATNLLKSTSLENSCMEHGFETGI